VLAIANLVTGTSRVFSGEIVTLSPDGRAFRRCQVVISGETTPSRIIYRRDLSASGWPLDAAIRAQVRSGESYGAPMQTSSSGSGSL